jgi:hypothetical protein
MMRRFQEEIQADRFQHSTGSCRVPLRDPGDPGSSGHLEGSLDVRGAAFQSAPASELPAPPYERPGPPGSGTVTLVVQVNDKLCDGIKAPAGTSEELARGTEKVSGHVEDREVLKEIVVPCKLVNLAVAERKTSPV